jgi:hypothetical protein
MEWTVDRGFLPINDPLISLPIADYKQTELIFTWENLAQIIPHYLRDNCLREELIFALRKANCSYCHGFVDSFITSEAYERVFLLHAYFAATYVNSPEGSKKTKLPKEISLPFSRVAHLVSRRPILDYTSFVLYNWKRITSSPIIIGNVEPLITFTDTDGEKRFISALIEMEYMGGRCFHNANSFFICDRLKRINKLLQGCDREFIKRCIVDVFFQDFNNLLYEGWLQEKQSFKCEGFSKSPFLVYLAKYLDNPSEEGYRKESIDARNECRREAEMLFRYLSFKD